MQHDIWKILFILTLAVLFGLAIDHIWEAISLTAIGIIGWQIQRLNVLYKWIENPNRYAMPETTGQLYLLHRLLDRQSRRRRVRQKKLSSLISRFRKAVEVIPDAIVLIDQHGDIQWANENANKLIGIHWPQDANLRLVNLVRDPKLVAMLDTPQNRSPEPMEVEIVTGRDLDRILNLKAIRYTEELRIILARDVTRIMRVNQMHADFVANVSHELKTPLTVLRGYLEILESSNKLDAFLAKPVQQMAAQSERMEVIVRDLLYLSRLEDTDRAPETQIVNLPVLVNAIIETIKHRVTEHGHKIKLDLDATLEIIGSNDELHSAVLNMVSNAINYTPKGGIIYIKWRGENKEAVLEVIDNGIGIPTGHLHRLTERFYRVDNDRSRDSGGTGLGLAIVKHVIQRHDARLEINSVEGEGSRFACYFPAKRIRLANNQINKQ